MAKIVTDPRSLPEPDVPIPGAKPPVFSLPFQDHGHPEFLKLIREIRREGSARPK
jgi:hypothetical protein